MCNKKMILCDIMNFIFYQLAPEKLKIAGDDDDDENDEKKKVKSIHLQ